jgi:hypothetical protein
MTSSDALFFIGKCLTLWRYPERIETVRETIRSGAVVWEHVVWVSTGQLVFPALYLQLKRAGLLEEVPSDLVEYMEEFTNRNRERNRNIINQAIEISGVLKGQGIAPIFLKGTANLLANLYEDIGERMMGDIDVLIDERMIPQVIEVLQANGYYLPEGSDQDFYPNHLHFPPLVKDGMGAAVEVHRWAVRKPYHKVFHFSLIDGAKKKIPLVAGAFVMSDTHKILHNMLVVQMNDKGYRRGQIYLRQMYDLLLLSEKLDPLKVASDFGRYFKRFNAYLAIASVILGQPGSIMYIPTWQAKLFLWRTRMAIKYPGVSKSTNFFINVYLQLYNYLSQATLSLFSKTIRRRLFRKLRNPKWYASHVRSFKSRV